MNILNKPALLNGITVLGFELLERNPIVFTVIMIKSDKNEYTHRLDV